MLKVNSATRLFDVAALILTALGGGGKAEVKLMHDQRVWESPFARPFERAENGDVYCALKTPLRDVRFQDVEGC